MTNPLAQALNDTIQSEHPEIFAKLSSLGKEIFFPKGIISQTAEAKHCSINAAIGIAKESSEPMHLKTVKNYISNDFSSKEIFPYAPTPGVPALRDLWQDKINQAAQKTLPISKPVVTHAITHGLSLVGEMFLDAADVVLLPELFWGNYKLLWQIKRQANLVTYPCYHEDLSDYHTNGLAQALKEHQGKKVMVVLNFPHNPTGYSPDATQVKDILNCLKTAADQGTQLNVVCDDAYQGLYYDDKVYNQSIFGKLSELHSNILAIKIDGCTKEFFMWGARIGFVTFGSKDLKPKTAEALEVKLASLVRCSVSSCNHAAQHMLIKALKSSEIKTQLDEKFATLKRRFQLAHDHATKAEYASYFTPYPFNSGYFFCLRILKANAHELRKKLISDFDLGLVSLNDQDLRIAFSCIEEADIPQVLAKIRQGIDSLLS